MQSAASFILLVVLLDLAAMSLYGCGSDDSTAATTTTATTNPRLPQISCTLVPPIENAISINATNTIIPHHGYAHYKCEEGYSINGKPEGKNSFRLQCHNGYFSEFEKFGCARYKVPRKCIVNETLSTAALEIQCKGGRARTKSEVGEGESCHVTCSEHFYETQPNRYGVEVPKAPTLLVCQQGVFQGWTPDCHDASQQGSGVIEFDVYAAFTKKDGDLIHPSGQTFNKGRLPSNIEVFDLEGLLQYMYTSVFADQQRLAEIPSVVRTVDGEWASELPKAPVYSGDVDTLVWYRLQVKNPSTIPSSKMVNHQFSTHANFQRGQSLTAVGAAELAAREAEHAKPKVTLTLKSGTAKTLTLLEPELNSIRGILTNFKDSNNKEALKKLVLKPDPKQNPLVDAVVAAVKVYICSLDGEGNCNWRPVESLKHGRESVLPKEILPGEPQSPTYLSPDPDASTKASYILVYSADGTDWSQKYDPNDIRKILSTDAQVIFLDGAVGGVSSKRGFKFESDDSWVYGKPSTHKKLRFYLSDTLKPFYDVSLLEDLRERYKGTSFTKVLSDMLQHKLGNGIEIEVVNVQKEQEAIKDAFVAKVDANTTSQIVGTYVGVKQDFTRTVKRCCKAKEGGGETDASCSMKSKWKNNKAEFFEKCYEFDERIAGDPRYYSDGHYNTFSLPGECPNLVDNEKANGNKRSVQCVKKGQVFLFIMKERSLDITAKAMDPNIGNIEPGKTSVSINLPKDCNCVEFKKLVKEVIYLQDKIQYPLGKTKEDQEAKRIMNKHALDTLNIPEGNYDISFVAGTSLLMLVKNEHGFVSGGLCPVGTVVPTGGAGCTYTIKEVASISLASITGITNERLCDGNNKWPVGSRKRKCTDIRDFKVHCSDMKHRVGVKLRGDDEHKQECLEYAVKPDSCWDCFGRCKDAERSLPFWENRCSKESNSRRLQKIQQEFLKAAHGSSARVKPVTTLQDCERLEHCDKPRREYGSGYCHRDLTGLCSPCYVPGTVKFKQKAIHTFQPGEMGIAFDDEGFVVEISPTGQADAKGISKGDQIVKVGTKKYTKDAVVNAENGRAAYKITFKVNPGFVAGMMQCRTDLFSSGGYAKELPICSPSERDVDNSSCCAYVGTCISGKLDWTFDSWSNCTTSGCGRGKQNRQASCSHTRFGDCRRYIGDPECNEDAYECLVSCDSLNQCSVEQDCRGQENKCLWAKPCEQPLFNGIGSKNQHTNADGIVNSRRLDMTDQKLPYCLPTSWGHVDSDCAWGYARRYKRCSLYDPEQAHGATHTGFCEDTDKPAFLEKEIIVETKSRLHGCARCSLDKHACQECIGIFSRTELGGCNNSEPFFQLGLAVSVPSESENPFLSISFQDLQQLAANATILAKDYGLKWAFGGPILLDAYLHHTDKTHEYWNLSVAVPWTTEESTYLSAYNQVVEGSRLFAGALRRKIQKLLKVNLEMVTMEVRELRLFCPGMREADSVTTPCNPESAGRSWLVVSLIVICLLLGGVGGGYFCYRRALAPNCNVGVELPTVSQASVTATSMVRPQSLKSLPRRFTEEAT